MKKRIIPYILFAGAILSACQADYFEQEPVTSVACEAIKLTVTSGDLVVAGGASSRATDDKQGTTVFGVGDSVGLIIVGKDGSLLTDNMPYTFNGTEWVCDSDEPTYYDGTMDKYIVYYPYEESVKGCKSIDDIKALEVFEIQDNQNDEWKFRHSDLMACTDKVTREINANLNHVRNCFYLDPKIKCMLNNGETIKFRPKRYLFFSADGYSAPIFQCETTGFEEFRIYKNNEKLIDYDFETKPDDIGKLYIHDDGSYRYILPKDEEIKLKWSYFYRGKTYGGEYTVKPREDEDSQEAGRRFVFDEIVDIGNFSNKDRKNGEELLQVNDFFCSKDGFGYPFPWEAIDLLNEHPCIGVIFKLGLHSTEDGSKKDNVVYTDDVYANSDHGYVIALTDAPDDQINFQKLKWRVKKYEDKDFKNNPSKNPDNAIVGPYFHADQTVTYWSGYRYLSAIKDYVETTWPDTPDEERWANLPAAYACKEYGERIPEMAAPDNTSGWFFPTHYQLSQISGVRGVGFINFEGANHPNTLLTRNFILTQRLASIRRKLPDTCDYKKYVNLYYSSSTDAHWVSSEIIEDVNETDNRGNQTGVVFYFSSIAKTQNLMGGDEGSSYKVKECYVRPALTF